MNAHHHALMTKIDYEQFSTQKNLVTEALHQRGIGPPSYIVVNTRAWFGIFSGMVSDEYGLQPSQGAKYLNAEFFISESLAPDLVLFITKVGVVEGWIPEIHPKYVIGQIPGSLPFGNASYLDHFLKNFIKSNPMGAFFKKWYEEHFDSLFYYHPSYKKLSELVI